MDRIDLHLNVPAVDINKLMLDNRTKPSGENSLEVKKRVIKARLIQKDKFDKLNGVHSNSDMKNCHLREYVKLSQSANLLLKQAVNKFSLSARTYFRLIKVGQTIADLAGKQEISDSHIAEALQYRVRSGE